MQVQDHEFTDWDDTIYCCLDVYTDGLTLENVKWAFTTFATAHWIRLSGDAGGFYNRYCSFFSWVWGCLQIIKF